MAGGEMRKHEGLISVEACGGSCDGLCCTVKGPTKMET